MRIEDREIDGPELERAQNLRATELDEGNDQAVNDHGTELETERRTTVLGAMKAIFAGNHLALEGLKLPARELAALEALSEAVEGRDASLSKYMYATDRSDLLEQALAVLQPNVAELPASFAVVIERVGSLRKDLRELGDSQDELLAGHHELAQMKGKPDDPDAKPDDDVDAAKPASTLDGPERVEPKKPPSTLTGPDVPEPKKPPSTLAGPEAPEPPRPASDLYDASADESEPIAPSAKSADAASEPKKPWWRRPFG